MQVFNERLKKIRLERGLRAGDIAKEVDVSINTYLRWELSIIPNKSNHLIKLADIFEVSIDYLLDREEIYISDSSILELKRTNIEIEEKQLELKKLELKKYKLKGRFYK